MTKNIIEAFDKGYTKGYQACKETLAQPVVKESLTVQKPLSDEELLIILKSVAIGAVRVPQGYKMFARAIEKHHGIGE